MQFTKENAEKINAGLKTQTRRPVKKGDAIGWAGIPGESPVVVRRNGRIIWQETNTYAIQPGRGKPAIGYITLKTIRKEQLQDISSYDAEREGIAVSHYYCDEGTDSDPIPMHRCDPVGKFRELWDSINGKRICLHWSDNPEVWVLEFKPKASPSEN